MMDDSAKSALETALRDFEPLFWAGPWADLLDRIYEPDGTLYAICLQGPTQLLTDRRKVHVNTGDLVIVPPAVALDCSTPARWFGIVYTGPYPYHFRERFIQVWGFEHIPLSGMDPNATAPDDLRHRIYISNVGDQSVQCFNTTEFTIRLSFQPDSAEPALAWAGPGQTLPPPEISHQQTVLFRIPLEATYLTHRLARPQPNPTETLSPEFRPESSPH